MKKYIYFDNAATTIGKPECVSRAIVSALDRLGNPGRSGHDLSVAAAEEVYNCRKSVCRLFGCDEPEKVVFTGSATMALNLAIKGYAVKNAIAEVLESAAYVTVDYRESAIAKIIAEI